VVSWNTRERLNACLASLSNACLDIQSGVEVFVVDNASTDGSAAMVCDHFPSVTLLVNETNVGFARANNQALRQCQTPYVLLLNSDAEVQSGAIQWLLSFMQEHGRAGAAGACLLNSDGSLQPSAQPMLTPEREFWRLSFADCAVRRATYRMHSWDQRTPRLVEVLKGACLVLRREALDEVGLLDDSYFMYTEEVDLCYRLAQAGWELWWVPQAKVVHHGSASTRQAAEAMYLALYHSKMQFFRKFGGEQRARCFKRLVRLAYWPRAVVTTLLAPVSSKVRARARIYRRLLATLDTM
jgi:GT2 family glycosyltransferase